MRLVSRSARGHRQVIRGYVESLAAVGSCTAIGLLLVPSGHLATIAGLYLIGITVVALRDGLWSGILAGLLSYLVIDYAFTPPLGQLDVQALVDVLVILTFLGAAGVASHLVGRAQAETDEARRRERAAQLIAGAVQALGPAEDLPALEEAVVAWASRAFVVRGCAVLLRGPDGRLEVRRQIGDCPSLTDDELARLGRTPWKPELYRTAHDPTRTRDLPMLAGDRVVGILRLVADLPHELLDDENLRVALIHHLGAAVERVRLHAEATEAEVLRRSDELKSHLLSLVSHELRTPLTVIKTAATSLRADDLASDARATLLAVIDQEANRLHHMVANLLDLSRIDGGALRLQRDWYDLGELARESVDRLRPSLAGQSVEIDVTEDLPPVPVDYLLIDRVVANLVLNAMHHTPREASIHIRARQVGSDVRLTVTDRGPGVPEAELSRIFERFYRRDGPWAGAGIGLALCKAIVEAHGGRVWAAKPANLPSGLAVTVALPLGSVQPEEPPSDGAAMIESRG